MLQPGVDALEIHTQVGRVADFKRLWQALAPWVDKLKLISVSCPDGDGSIDYLWALYELMTPLPCPIVWQTDGRPMSGDIGIGTTRAAVKLGEKVLAANLPGYVQLAGGTNNHTVAKLQAARLLNPNPKSTIQNPQSFVAGIAYGSYARVLLSPVLEQLEKISRNSADANAPYFQSSLSSGRLEETPQLLWEAVAQAYSLVSQLKSSVKGKIADCG